MAIKRSDSEAQPLPDLQQVEDQLGIRFSDRSLLQQAFVHRSFVNEVVEGDLPNDNERLEFLGDSVLGFVTSAYLYDRYPDLNEGELTRLRSSLVRGSTLARVARRLNLGAHLWLGRGEEESGGRERDATLCAVTEAVIGALYLDQGMEIANRCVLMLLQPEIDKMKGYSEAKDPKSRLQEYMQSRFGRAPRYTTLESTGPDHAKRFIQKVALGRKMLGAGWGYQKKTAEQRAAAMALDYLGEFSPEYEPDEEFESQFTLAPLDSLDGETGK